MYSSGEIRQKFLGFFKKRGHAIVPSSSLIPTDPSVLLTTAGMQQFKPYFVGTADPKKDFGSLNTVSIQKCFRTSDIDEVGDESHLTFFEMLGDFSFGGYFKKEAIEYAHEFITKELKLKIGHVTVFKGDSPPAGGVPADEESEKIWQSLGVKDIKRAGRADNFWGPTGAEGPCGPTTEIYINDVEIWNIVFNEYYMHPDKTLEPLKQKGVDTGMGLERLVTVTQGKSNIFETDLFSSIFKILPDELDTKTKRIFADHARGICFLIADGIRPSNKEAGYILRRLLRRLIGYQANVDIKKLFEIVVNEYGDFYKELNLDVILSAFESERLNFENNIPKAIQEMERRLGLHREKNLKDEETRFITEKQIEYDIFDLYQTFGMPIEMIEDLLAKYHFRIDKTQFRKVIEKRMKEHQEISRAGMEKKFGGHGLILNTGELKAGNEEELNKVLRLHTATHLLQAALREVLGPEVKQAGSDITAERTRFDFSYPRKLTPEEIKKVEDLVNQKIKEDLPVNFKEMPKDEAQKTGALHFFSAKGGSSLGGKEKYPDKVKVYYVGKSLEDAWSKEFCGGPHVSNTGVIGKFEITKEESVGLNIRRVRAKVLL